MKRSELEHLIRAAAAITNARQIMIVGSQSVLGAFPRAPNELLESMAANIHPFDRPDLAELIDGSIGELSPFHKTFGYYAKGVGNNTAVLPDQWESRLVSIQEKNTDLKVGLCLDPHDLAVSKLVADRQKDRSFVGTMLDHKMLNESTLSDRIKDTSKISIEQKKDLLLWVSNSASEASRSDTFRHPGYVNIADYPQLQSVAWNRRIDDTCTEVEALDLYERNWRFIDQEALTPAEKSFIEHLVTNHGKGVLLV